MKLDGWLGVGELNADKCNGSTQYRGKVTLRCLHLSSARVEAVEDNPRPYARTRPLHRETDKQTEPDRDKVGRHTLTLAWPEKRQQ